MTSAGTSTFAVDISGYSKFLLTCGLASTSNGNYYRTLNSVVIPKSVLTSVTRVGHGDGAHQAYYSLSFHSGISYTATNTLKIYNSGSIARLYAR